MTRIKAHVDVNRARGATRVAPRAISRRPLYVGTSVLHPAYLLGLAAILVRGYAPPFIVNTDHWTATVNWVIARAT